MRALLIAHATGPSYYFGLLLLLAAALGLRVYGITFGLPHLYYWDEPAVVNRAIRFGSGDLNPHFFYYPAFYMYVLSVMSGLYFLTQLVAGNFASVDDFAVQYFVDPSGVYLTARLTTAVIGTACVLAIFLVGRQYFGPLVGYLAGLFLAVSVGHSTQSHVAVTDVPHSLFVLLALLPIYRIMKARGTSWRDYALAGLLIGFGTATKYFAILLVPSLMAAHYLSSSCPFGFARAWPRPLGCWFSPTLILAGATTFLGFFMGSPFNILDFGTFMSHYQNQVKFSGAGEGGTASWFLLLVLPASLGWPVYLLSLVGIGWLVLRHGKIHMPWLIFLGLYFFLTSRAGVAFSRYMIPVEVLLCLSAAFAAVSIASAIAGRVPACYTVHLRVGMALALLGVIVWPVASILRWNWAMAHQADPRTVALEWMEQHVPPGSPIAVQSLHNKTTFNVPVMTDLRMAEISQDIPRGRRFDAVRERALSTLRNRTTYREIPFVYDFEALADAGTRFIVVSNLNWPHVELGTDHPDSPEMRFKQDLHARATLLNCFGPSAPFELGTRSDVDAVYPIVPPTIRVYRIGPAIDDSASTPSIDCGSA